MAKHDDYQLPSDEYGDEKPFEEAEPSAAPSRGGLGSALKNRKVWVPLLLLTAIFAVYQFLSMEGKKSADTTPTLTSRPTDTNNGQFSTLSNVNAALQQQIASIATEADNNKTQLQQLQATVDQVQAVQANFNTALTTLNQQLQAVSAKLDQLLAVKPTASAPVRPVAHKPAAPTTLYTVKAVLPGRAWLQSSRGERITVRIGQQLPGYGEITSIDPASGVVSTRSGRTINYGKYDS